MKWTSDDKIGGVFVALCVLAAVARTLVIPADGAVVNGFTHDSGYISIVAERVRKRFNNLEGKELQRAVLHDLIQWQVGDLLAVASKTLTNGQIDSVEKVLGAGRVMVASAELGELKANLEGFLYQRVYRHPQVLAMRSTAQQKLAEMFDCLAADPQRLPEGFRGRLTVDGVLRTVGDYLAGMTDRYALWQYDRLCGPPSG